MSRFQVRKVAVLGAGVMGAQIAAHLVNVKVPVVLFDLPAKEGPKNGIVTKAIEGLKKLKPAPLGDVADAALIQQANYEEHLELLKDCDLIIEAIAERMDWKLDLYKKIAPFIAPHAIVASNTSGLSITKLSEVLPEEIKPRFCGIHFFNPPRYMYLVELINTPTTLPAVIDQLESFVTTAVGKGVVRANDTPNFVANRVGIAGMMATMIEAEKFGLSVDVVDDLTGKKLGRASSGTFRTADVVGLDTMAHVVKTMQDNLKDDPFYSTYATPEGAGRSDREGRPGPEGRRRFLQEGRARTSSALTSPLGSTWPAARRPTRSSPACSRSPRPIASSCCANRPIRRPSSCGPSCATASTTPPCTWTPWPTPRARSTSRCAGASAAAQGPFELWQAAGWKQVAEWISADIAEGKTLSSAPLPAWVTEGPVADNGGVHSAAGSWSAAECKFKPRAKLPVYERQAFPESLVGEGAAEPLKRGTEEFKNEEVRVWTLDGEVLIASITAKLHLISPTVTEGLLKAVEIAEAKYKGLVIWSPDDVFSAGANLEALMPVFMKSGAKGIAPEEKKLQDMMLRIRYANVPVVAAVRGLALGGGCRAGRALRTPCRPHGKLCRPGRSRRGPDPRRRWPDLHRPPRGRDGQGRQCRRRHLRLPEGRLHHRGHGQGCDLGAGSEEERLLPGQRRVRAEQGRTAATSPRPRPRPCSSRATARR